MITTASAISPIDVESIRKQFPVLSRTVKGKPLVYLDNAATSQKPTVVLDALVGYYTGMNANIHRGIHTLAEEATAAFEATRDTVMKFINAADRAEIIFTKGTTEGINLVASTWGRQNITAGDEIIITAMEHHSNIVPWQMLCEEKGAILKVVPVSDEGEISLDDYKVLINSRTKLVSVVHVSNALGTINPIREMIEMAHDAGAVFFADGAQSSVHLEIDVQDLDCDFFAFSAHKIYGPTGVGVLYGKRALLESMPPYMGGGEMIREVSFEKTTYNEIPYKFEAGTPNIADVVAFRAALDFVTGIGKEKIAQHENALLEYATSQLQEIEGLTVIGRAVNKASVLSFVIKGVHPADMGVLLDNNGIAVRTGHHCAQPLMLCYKIPGTIRASFAVYNTFQEVDALAAGIRKAIRILL
jgi:cysteine desulfurase / selenocysteine lyase